MNKSIYQKVRKAFNKGFVISLYLFTILFSPLIFAQNSSFKNVKGIVTNKNTGETLIGVAVFIPHSPYHAVTNAKGEYSLNFIPQKNTVISFQLLGMKTKNVRYKSQKEINVQLEDDKQLLNDVVVTGYVKLRKSGFTGNTTKITKEELLKVSPKNAIAAIQVFDPSFRIAENINAGANPNALPEFYMRGQTAVKLDKDISVGSRADISRQALSNNNNLPIFILDGFEVGVEKIYDLDPNRISSITLLKDASATALYGSRAANGVVVIVTRAPKEGKLRVTYNLNGGVQFPDLTAYNLMNASEKLQAELDAGYYKLDKDPTDQNITSLLDYKYYIRKLNNVKNGVNTDWLRMPVRVGFNHRHSLYIDGGTKNLRWATELKYSLTNGVMRGSDRKTYGAGFLLDYRVGKVQFLNRFDYDGMGSNELPDQSFSTYSHLEPYFNYIDPITGKYLAEFTGYSSAITNPLYELNYTKSFKKMGYDSFSNKLSMNILLLPELSIKSQLSIARRYNAGKTFLDPASPIFNRESDPRNYGRLSVVNGSNTSLNFNTLLLYNKVINKNFINFSAGGEVIENNSELISSSYRGFASGSQNSINNAQKIDQKPARASNKTRLMSFISMFNYSYNDIYLFDASLRLDGSSEFGSDQKVAPFWASGVGINLHKFDFIKNLKFINNFKIRASYGQLGKVNFPVYAAQTTYVSTSTNQWYLTGIGNIMNYLGNNKLSWEKTDSFDAGFDLALFQNRFYGKFTYYNKTTKDMITAVSLPSSSGFSSYMANIGQVRNRGIELDLRCVALKNENSDLTLFANLSHNNNTLLKISDALKNYNKQVDELYADYNDNKNQSKYSVPHSKFIEGGSTTAIFAMRSLGINPANGQEVFLRPNGEITYDWNAADQIIAGDTEPLARGAFGFNARYKQFSIFTTFLYRFGGYQYNQTLVNYVEDSNIISSNVDKRVGQSRWKKPGDVSSFKNISKDIYITRPSSRFVQRENLVEFNSLSLSYDFSQRICKRLGISMLRFTASMQDIAYLSTIRRERGLDYPYAKNLNFTLNLTF